MRVENIKREAARLKAKFQTNDPKKLCQELGIRVLEHDMGCGQNACKGYLLEVSRCKTALINSALPEEVRRIILAHELGHGILHMGLAFHAFHDVAMLDDSNRMEYEANVFAAELLVSDDDFFDVISRHPDLFDAASALNVPPELLDFKIRQLQREGHDLSTPEFTRSDFLKRDITKPVM